MQLQGGSQDTEQRSHTGRTAGHLDQMRRLGIVMQQARGIQLLDPFFVAFGQRFFDRLSAGNTLLCFLDVYLQFRRNLLARPHPLD